MHYQSEVVSEKVKGLTLKMGFYDPKGEFDFRLCNNGFDSQNNDTTQREQKHIFMFKNELSKLNGQEVVLRMEKKLPDSEQFTL